MSGPGPEATQRRAGYAELEYRPGDPTDFDRLYRAIYQRIYATMLVILRDPPHAEDATQEAFLRGFRAWSAWKRDAPAEAWMHRIALNVAFSYRRRERLNEVGELIRRLGRPADPDPIGRVQTDLWRELRALPPRQAAAIVLRHLHGYSNREIAFALGIPERTVASRLSAAKARLKVRLNDEVPRILGTPEVSRVLLG